jgi:DNA repair protein RecN (Recombination protein N)
MLSLLHIENIAVIELCDITFDARLNILTGETGAGKSIVIDALSALLGQRTSRDLIRSGFTSAWVSGVFSQSDGSELSIERELREDGRNLCKADGKPVTLAALREMGGGLINIHGQHDSQALLREETHIFYLDAYAGLPLERYNELYELWHRLNTERDKLSMAEDEKRARIDMLTFRLAELRELDPKPGEEESLNARRKTLRNAGAIQASLSEAYFALYGDEETRGACELAEQAASALAGIVRNAPETEDLAERLNEIGFALKDCAGETRGFIEGMEDCEEELERVETRLDALSRLRRKHAMEIDAVVNASAQWERELQSLQSADKRLQELDGELASVYEKLLREGSELSKRRGEAASGLEKRVEGELRDLDMGKVRFAVDCSPSEPGERGCDSVRFLISANVGEETKPLSKIASGGEMARIMLALKNLLAEGDEVATLVFDEVDSGVSGQAARRVAQKLCDVSRHKQVLCVTHLPQLAAFADSHFHVEKSVENGRTVTRVRKLNDRERAEELARIMAGSNVTDAARETAAELLSQADTYKQEAGYV